MPPPRSDVWRYYYYTKISQNEAKCNYCSKMCKTSGNTSNLKSHLKIHKIKDKVPCSPVKPKPVQPDKDLTLPSQSSSPKIKAKLMKFSKLSSSGLAIPSTSSSVVDSDEARGSTSPPAPMDRMDVTGPASTFENPHTQTSIRQATTNLAPVLPRLPAPRPGQQTSILQSFGGMKKYSGELNALYRFMYKEKFHTTAK